MRWIPGSMPHGAWLGRLERSQLDEFISCIGRGTAVWDVGANVGLYAIPSGRAVGEDGQVVAFEPIPRNIAFLRRHIELNSLPWVQVVEAAVADRSASMQMSPGDSASEARLAEDGEWAVAAIALDEWRARTGARPPALVKIDVEGAEDRVIAGAVGTLREFGPIVFLSLHGDRQRDTCASILMSLGYDVRSLQADLPVGLASEWRADRPQLNGRS
jgi:FkbM family methyltransferase